MILQIGKLLFFLVVTGILGVGFFCGGVFAGWDEPVFGFMVWGLGIFLWVLFTRFMYWNKKTKKTAEWDRSDKYQRAVVTYIVDARNSGISDQLITTNLLQAGWTQEDIDDAFRTILLRER